MRLLKPVIATWIDESIGQVDKWFIWVNSGVVELHVNGPTIGAQFLAATPFTPEVGAPDVAKADTAFRAYPLVNLEGLVSKRLDRAYRGGRCTHWIKVKNPGSLAMNRAAEIDWSR